MTPIDDRPASVESGGLAGAESTAAARSHGLPPVWTVLTAGLLAGLAAWGLGEWAERIPTTVVASEFEVGGSQQFALRAAGLTTKARYAYGALGASLGLAMGLAGGWIGRSSRRAITAGALGLVLGSALGVATSSILVPLFVKNERTLEDDLVLPLLTHGGIWSAVGLAGGLALGIGLGLDGRRSRWVNPAIGGLLGGALAALIYEPLGAVLFPLEKTAQPISEGVGSRLFGRLIVAGLVAGTAALVALSAGRRSKSGNAAS